MARTTAAKTAAPQPAPTPSQASIEAALTELPALFASTQTTLSTHRRSHVALYKLFAFCAAYRVTSPDGSKVKLTGERMFLSSFKDAMDHVLEVKKGANEADKEANRVIAFMAGFIVHAIEQGKRCHLHTMFMHD